MYIQHYPVTFHLHYTLKEFLTCQIQNFPKEFKLTLLRVKW